MAQAKRKFSNIPHEDYTLEQIEFGDRFRKEYKDLDLMKQSILDTTLIHPFAVTRNPDGAEFPVKLVAGGTRLKAMEELIAEGKVENLFTCRVFDEIEIDEHMLRMIELTENARRSSMNFYEDAALKEEITRLEIAKHGPRTTRNPDDPGASTADTAKILNCSQSQIQSDLKLKAQMDALKDKIDWGKHTTRSEVKAVIKQVKKQAERTVGAAVAKKAIGSSVDEKLLSLTKAYRIDDCTKGMAAIGSATIDFAEIDPPYAIDLKRVKRDMDKNYDSYNEVPVEKYIPLMRAVFDECWRVMKADSWMVCWYGPEPWAEVMRYLLEGGTAESATALYESLQLPTPNSKLTSFMPNYGHAKFKTHRMVGIWNKEHGQTQQPAKRLGNAYETFYYVRKGNPDLNQPGKSNMFSVPPVNPQVKVHPTERPAELISRLLELFVPAGSRVVVPFAGSGRTLLEAAKLDMIPYGFDLSQGYKDSYMIALNKEIK